VRALNNESSWWSTKQKHTSMHNWSYSKLWVTVTTFLQYFTLTDKKYTLLWMEFKLCFLRLIMTTYPYGERECALEHNQIIPLRSLSYNNDSRSRYPGKRCLVKSLELKTDIESQYFKISFHILGVDKVCNSYYILSLHLIHWSLNNSGHAKHDDVLHKTLTITETDLKTTVWTFLHSQCLCSMCMVHYTVSTQVYFCRLSLQTHPHISV
jgi:hypothetical protein